jgi:hypothetical protein
VALGRIAALLVFACLAGLSADGRAADADPNARDQNGYTPLARLLFDQKIGSRSKLELVRQLLDAGANVNGNHGGWGRAGALGHARREEPEVIALLVARGATLAAPEGGGPISIAIEMERDDLALALLGRDRKVGPQDRAALPLAARRGWRPVVTALLAAGADANAGDAQGATALALAERRRDAAMSKALVAAGARPAARAPSAVRPGPDFFSLAAKEVDEVVFFDPPRFALDRERDAPFAFYGEAMNQFKEVSCERSASFGIIASANMAGAIRTGICVREARRVRALAASAQPALAGMLALLSQEGVKLDPAKLDKLGWRYAKSVGADGAEEHYFPLVAIGHGIGSLPTLVRVSRDARRAIVVQADTMKLCENYGLQNQTPLCSDTRQALTDIARRLDARFGD